MIIRNREMFSVISYKDVNIMIKNTHAKKLATIFGYNPGTVKYDIVLALSTSQYPMTEDYLVNVTGASSVATRMFEMEQDGIKFKRQKVYTGSSNPVTAYSL